MFSHSKPRFRAGRHAASSRRARLMLASTLALMLLPAGCTATGRSADLSARQERFLAPTLLMPQEPSQRAELIFAQLKLDAALDNNDKDAVLDAAERLLRFGTGPYKLPSSAPIIDAAIWLLAHDHENDAVLLIQSASEQMPDELALVSLQADLLIQHNSREEAIELLRSFAAGHPADGQAQAELALALLRSGRTEDAMTVFRRIPEKQLTPQIRFAYAQALNVSGRFAEARVQLNAAVKEDPEYSEAWQLLALTLEELDRKAEAKKIYRNLLDSDPDNRSARLFLIRLLLQENNMDAVVATISESHDPLHFSVASAAMLMDEKLADQAEKLLSRLEKQPGMPEGIYFYHAALLYETGMDPERALSLLDRLSRGSPEYDKALRMKVRILYERKRFPEALQALDDMRRLRPTDVEPLLLTAELLTLQKDFKAADKVLAEALHLQPDNENAAFQQAYLQEVMGNRPKAMALMEKVVEKFPDNALALNYVGYNLADGNRELDRAYALLQRAVELEPEADFILDSLAWVHFRRGELEDAWEQIQKALDASDKSGPGDPAMFEHYGDIAFARGDGKNARQGWQKALELFQGMDFPEDAARVRLKLEKHR
ncbi:tetratricopeptide repeat protein [Mailhella massiliensis]|uniref:Tetratricopeptide repeat protein n=1 Tax=Mailhella massiliensis TaxID=1903261 RepID=A0A921AU67_9BACT|nr:tetratricopeptide repeat protein [Mailhella massiliensis]HJD96203.1 tetratricopeptide repeat protein [Mailhella massiliensis]